MMAAASSVSRNRSGMKSTDNTGFRRLFLRSSSRISRIDEIASDAIGSSWSFRSSLHSYQRHGTLLNRGPNRKSLRGSAQTVQYFLSMPPYFSSMEKSDNG